MISTYGRKTAIWVTDLMIDVFAIMFLLKGCMRSLKDVRIRTMHFIGKKDVP